ERGGIGETWWSKRWVGVLESFSLGTRLTRGRAYARQGQVISIDVEPGVVKAKVQGSQPKPYNVKIKLKPLSDEDWDKVTEVRSERGGIGETWWSKRWVGVLESFSLGTRLTRGRAYARQGQVISIDVEPGVVKAKVQGSQPKPYNVKIKLKPLSDEDWDKVTEV